MNLTNARIRGCRGRVFATSETEAAHIRKKGARTRNALAMACPFCEGSATAAAGARSVPSFACSSTSCARAAAHDTGGGQRE